MQVDYYDCSDGEIIAAINQMSSDSFNACCNAVAEWQSETTAYNEECQSEIDELADSQPDSEFDKDAAYRKHWEDYDVFSDELRQTLLAEYSITEEQFSLIEAAGNRENEQFDSIWPYVIHVKDNLLLRLL